jgi:hypothetical protein
MRPYWKGYLKLALVSCPISLRSKALNAVNAILKRDNTGVMAESAGAAQLRPSCVSPTPQLKRE